MAVQRSDVGGRDPQLLTRAASDSLHRILTNERPERR
jgi:hypothetical protein